MGRPNADRFRRREMNLHYADPNLVRIAYRFLHSSNVMEIVVSAAEVWVVVPIGEKHHD